MTISWENFNESQELKAQIENYKNTYGCYPESVHVDKIYRTKDNRKWCKERGISLIPINCVFSERTSPLAIHGRSNQKIA